MLTSLMFGGLALIAGPIIVHAEVIPASFPIHQEVATTTEGIVREVQFKYGLGDDFYETAKCESSFNKDAVGDHGNSHGVWQIHKPSWPSISLQNARDPHWSSEWAAKQFLEGNAHIWTCWRNLPEKKGP